MGLTAIANKIRGHIYVSRPATERYGGQLNRVLEAIVPIFLANDSQAEIHDDHPPISREMFEGYRVVLEYQMDRAAIEVLDVTHFGRVVEFKKKGPHE